MKIAVSGKGGVGKTLIAGTLARLFAQNDYNVLAIDNDSAMNLSYTLGIDKEIRNTITPISKMKELIKERVTMEGGGSGVYNINPQVADIPDRFKIKVSDNLELLVLGSIEEPQSGCLCPENALIRTLLHNLITKRDEILIVDFEAGLEHLGRGTAKGIDLMLIVTEPSQKSLELSLKIAKLSKKLGIINIYLIANKIINNNQISIINQRISDWKIPLYHIIPYDEEIGNADLQGTAPIDYAPNSKSLNSLKTLFYNLLELKKEIFDL
ncbi:MAG: AAA family ATPase [Candidatus Lokiarchaeota archaeon]|nr:AAA family ATPase [Candidatus Lokiarchaeota archaeon]